LRKQGVGKDKPVGVLTGFIISEAGITCVRLMISVPDQLFSPLRGQQIRTLVVVRMNCHLAG
jgi:hypothetical protein